jgi:hypothetical protein
VKWGVLDLICVILNLELQLNIVEMLRGFLFLLLSPICRIDGFAAPRPFLTPTPLTSRGAVPFEVNLVAGMVGGAIGVGTAYPLDTIKAREPIL